IAALVAGISANGAQPLINLFANAYNKVYVDNTMTVHKPSVFALPTTQYQLLARTLLNDGNASNITVLEFLKKNFPDMEFVDDIGLKGAGLGDTDRMIVYKR